MTNCAVPTPQRPGRDLQSDVERPWQRGVLWGLVQVCGLDNWWLWHPPHSSRGSMKDTTVVVGIPHMVMNMSPVAGADPGQEKARWAHILLPLCLWLSWQSLAWLGVGAFLPRSWRALAVPFNVKWPEGSRPWGRRQRWKLALWMRPVDTVTRGLCSHCTQMSPSLPSL